MSSQDAPNGAPPKSLTESSSPGQNKKPVLMEYFASTLRSEYLKGILKEATKDAQ